MELVHPAPVPAVAVSVAVPVAAADASDASATVELAAGPAVQPDVRVAACRRETGPQTGQEVARQTWLAAAVSGDKSR